MAQKKRGGGGDGGGHGGAPWVITFADLMSLLMALFVMIVSFSSQDEQKLNEAAGSMRDAFGYQSVQRPAGMIEQNGLPERKYLRNVEAMSLSEAVEFATDFNDQYEKQGPEVNTNRFEKAAESKPREYLTASESLRQALQDLPDYAELSKQIILKIADDGLHISIIDQDGRPMFASQSREPTERLKIILSRIAPVIQQMPGRLRIVGHTESVGHMAVAGGGAWQLSADRAISAAGILGSFGLGPGSLAEVTGVADKDPMFPDDPFLSGNRRIELIMLKEAAPLPTTDAFPSGLP
ncbi:flagellar motor protein MotB [Pleomorphomonas sp. NRK KF1]|uniref:OmpA/MotB family protein n=1 Tax=Pleomorphomonas sp. NRK KF1 TaxID=2943000 RepID=UPI002042EB83|nr:flagellar motor protein MotB [Pleomorphomonas sp. NRK KF1]MCM5555193.1 flagellar motor protein MotB [Pleomorphomonas sp. NRK KF1]